MNPDVLSPADAGTNITWTAEAEDADNDQIFYQFLLNDGVVQNWSMDNNWIWATTEANASDNQIEVRIRDGKHAGPESYDDNEVASFSIICAAVSIHTPNEVRAGLVNEAYVANYSPEARYYWSIEGGELLSGQGSNYIKWFGRANSTKINISVIKINENTTICNSTIVRVIPNLREVGLDENLSNLINDYDNTTYSINANPARGPIYINMTEHKNNRAFLIIEHIGSDDRPRINGNFSQFAIAIDNSTNVSIINLCIENAGFGLLIENSSHIKIYNNSINAITDEAIYIRRSHEIDLTKNNLTIADENEEAITVDKSTLIKVFCNKVNDCDNRRVINLTDSRNNYIYFKNDRGWFIDSGYKCEYFETLQCTCRCDDQSRCADHSADGRCIHNGHNLINSENDWHFRECD